MVYIVLDLEWNQPVSRNSYPYLSIGDKMSGEIIQIGAYKVSDEIRIIDSFCRYIKPKYYKKLNSIVKQLTNIDKEKIRSGKDFCEAVESFKEWCGNGEFCIFTWGSDDINIMAQNLSFYKEDKSFIHNWYDLQKIFSDEYIGEAVQKSLPAAMEYFKILQDKTRNFHDAYNDAYYTAQILMRHDIKKCIAKYRHESDFMTICAERDDMKYGGFPTKISAITDKRVRTLFCPECGHIMSRKSSWAAVGSKYTCKAKCKKDGEYTCRIKLNKHIDGKFYVSKIIKKALFDQDKRTNKENKIQTSPA